MRALEVQVQLTSELLATLPRVPPDQLLAPGASCLVAGASRMPGSCDAQSSASEQHSPLAAQSPVGL
eukprot:15439411-Alexandrium_andersonii.AAC.1